MKKIGLTQGKVAIVDDDSFNELSQFSWCYDNGGGYAVRNIYPFGRKRPVKIYMHRVIVDAPKDRSLVVDHINQNSLDNRQLNLRVTDRRTNLENSPRYHRKGVLL